ncbi:MAG: GGDEF domain-containing protein [Candidatus ainarchaeum sp.]|nr:GGDEF domain-containing protein [Candidatus ainarchaeum sp.]
MANPAKRGASRRKPVVGQIPLPIVLDGHRRNPIAAANSLRRAEEEFSSAMQRIGRRGVNPYNYRADRSGIDQRKANLGALVAAGRLAATRSKLSRLALLDAKFNIANNAAFTEMFYVFLRSRKAKRPFCFATIDMDNMRRINETLGHDKADAVIGFYVQQVSGAAKKCGGFVGRVGGDELRIFAPVNARELKLALTEALGRLKGRNISFSAGVVASESVKMLLSEQKKFEALCGYSDKATYASKKAGRAQVTIW